MVAQDKVIASALVVHGTTGVIWTMMLASHHDYRIAFLIPNLVLAVAGVVAGLACYRAKRWGMYVGMAFYAIQTPQIFTTSFFLSFTLGINLIFAVGWFDFGKIGVNVVGLVMFCWISRRTKVHRHREAVSSPQ